MPTAPSPPAAAPTTRDTRRWGWRERIEPGIYRMHRRACPASADERAGRRCACPYQVLAPAAVPGRSRTVTVAGGLREARATKRALQAAGRPAPAPAPGPEESLTEFTARYLRARAAVLSPHTIAGTETEYRLRIAPALGELRLGEITRERVERWLADLVATGAGRRMVVQSVAALRGILAVAVDWGRIPANPAARLRLPAPATHERQAVERVLDEGQLARLLASAGSLSAETMLRAAAEGGLRRGEIIGLRWADVRLDERRLVVRRSVWQVAGERGERTAKGRRARKVAISEGFGAHLVAWREQARQAGGGSEEDYVWPGRDGGPMSAHSPTQTTTRALCRAGLVDGVGRPLVTLHGLRHTCGSILLARGVPLIVVSRHLGHADPNITARVYAHLLSDAQLDQAAEVFGALSRTGTMQPAMHAASVPA